MRLIFFILILSQILNLLSVFAEKFKSNPSDIDQIKWEKLKENNTNNLEKIIWKSYQGDESYFQKSSEENPTINFPKYLKEINKFESQSNTFKTLTEIEPFS